MAKFFLRGIYSFKSREKATGFICAVKMIEKQLLKEE